MSVRVSFYNQDEYDAWIASKPDFSRVTYFRVANLPLVTVLPDLPACTYFRADKRITALRRIA